MIHNEPDDPDNALLAGAEEATRQAVARLAVRQQIPEQQRLLDDVEKATQRQQPRGGSALRAPGEKVSETS